MSRNLNRRKFVYFNFRKILFLFFSYFKFLIIFFFIYNKDNLIKTFYSNIQNISYNYNYLFLNTQISGLDKMLKKIILN